ncbi:MAG TPA: cytochrome c [Pyrinomonadaceae bacterium]|nr:cytochrome c [Pyrinomonadaceae bacterium]
MKLVALTILIGAAVAASACSRPETVTTNQSAPVVAVSPATKANATPDEFAFARVTFQKDCAGCHGEDGAGGMKTVDGKKLNVPSFHEGHALKHSEEEFVKQIMNGGDGMPAFKDKMSSEQTNEMVRFVREVIQSSGH